MFCTRDPGVQGFNCFLFIFNELLHKIKFQCARRPYFLVLFSLISYFYHATITMHVIRLLRLFFVFILQRIHYSL